MQAKWLILSAVSLGSLMATLDGSIVNIALPAIQADFGIDLTTVEWVVVAYLLIVGSLLLPMGRLGEVATFKRVYLAGFAVFTAASVLCGLAPDERWLIGFRVIQAIGAAAIMAMGPAVVARTFDASERGRALGLNGVSVSLGLSLGPVIGGVLTQVASWRSIFLINAPIGVVAILWAWRVLPSESRGRRQSFDVRGAVLSGAALFCLLLALSEGQGWGWTSPVTLGLLAAFVALGAAFLVAERRTAEPVLELSLFRIRPFGFGLASVVVAMSGLFTATFLLPFLLEQGRGFDPIEAGLLLTPLPIAMAVVAPLAGTIADRIGSAIPAAIGIVLMVVALLSLTQLPMDFALPDLVWRLVLLGIGQGLFMSPNSAAVLGSVPGRRVGTASGTLAQMRVTGQALGIALSAAIVATRLPAYLAENLSPSVAQAAAIHDAFFVAAAVCAIGIATSLVRGSGHRGQVEAQEPALLPQASAPPGSRSAAGMHTGEAASPVRAELDQGAFEAVRPAGAGAHLGMVPYWALEPTVVMASGAVRGGPIEGPGEGGPSRASARRADTRRQEVRSTMTFRRRDAWWEMDGKAARGERRRQRFVATVAFLTATAATAGAATMWWMHVGAAAVLHARFGIL